jgi:hypothetical protein
MLSEEGLRLIGDESNGDISKALMIGRVVVFTEKALGSQKDICLIWEWIVSNLTALNQQDAGKGTFHIV